MLYSDNGKWTLNRYEITYTERVYGDFTDGFPEDATVTEIILTTEQQARLDEIQGISMPEMDAIAYVRDGIGTPPDTRTEVDRLIDMISNLTPAILEMVPHWAIGEPYPKGHYVRQKTAMYKVTKPHKSETPPEVSAEYLKVYEV